MTNINDILVEYLLNYSTNILLFVVFSRCPYSREVTKINDILVTYLHLLLLVIVVFSRCHADRSGFDGPWTFSPTAFSNSFYVELLNRNWQTRKWSGPNQFADKETGQLMMLPADMVFAKDSAFKTWAELYAKDENRYFQDFAKAYKKLLELGVPFKQGAQEYRFKPTSA